MRYGHLLLCSIALGFMANPVLAASNTAPSDTTIAMLTGIKADSHNAPIPVPAHAAQSPMGFNPVTTVDPGPADALPAPLSTDAPAVLKALPPSSYPPRRDNEDAATMMPTATTMTAAQAAAIPSRTDFASLCPANAAGNVDIHTCLVKADAAANARLDAAQTTELKIARGGPDWQEGRKQAQLLSVSAMSFNAYRDSECLRQQQAADPGREQTGNIMLACQIRLTRARLAMLGQPQATAIAVRHEAPAQTAPSAPAPSIDDGTVLPMPLTPMDMQPLPPPPAEP